MAEQPRVVLYGRQGCHLCEAAREVVARVCAETGDQWVEVDIDAEDEAREDRLESGSEDPSGGAAAGDLGHSLVDRFGDEVPVTFVDGRQHDFWRVDEARLRAALLGGPAR